MTSESPQTPTTHHPTPGNDGLSPLESDEGKLRVCDHCRMFVPRRRNVRDHVASLRDFDVFDCRPTASINIVDSEQVIWTFQRMYKETQALDQRWVGLFVRERSAKANRPLDNLPQRLAFYGDLTESTRLNLYFIHIQPNYPLFESCPDRRPGERLDMSPRLKMALFAVSSRFVAPGFLTWSPGDFAQRAKSLFNDSDLSVDELKASFLLCFHAMSDSLTWATVTEATKITRMADLYYKLHLGGKRNESDTAFYLGSDGAACRDGVTARQGGDAGDLGSKMKEWNRVWWCIYRLDACCCATTTSPNPISTRLEEEIRFPFLPNTESLYQPALDSERHQDVFQPDSLSRSKHPKHWQTMRAIFSQPSCRNQNLYLGVCSFVRSVTDLRCLVKSSRGRGLEDRLRELESDSAATAFALPLWYFQPVRNLVIAETEEDHASRLKNLLVWSCTNLLLAICAADMSSSRSSGAAASDLPAHWRSILDKANDATDIIRKWKPAYVDVVDPMCSYIVLLVGSILSFERELSSEKALYSSQLDLLELFLEQIGTRWPIANRLAKSLQSIQVKLISEKPTIETALTYVSQLTNPFNGQPVHPALKGEASGASTLESMAARDVRTGDYAMTSVYDEGYRRYSDLDHVDFTSLEGVLGGMDPMDMLLQVGCGTEVPR
ncbi:hypothetical protein CORC01_12499 [Colletotrichum orchidophilum]|uniref:Transcription factor domain-containing protein n=1 Tax=Colletotrichum orchidophilum TaxID=1209926 RepID=A0A1G4ASW4_9PEZI|nr:uncharacterized protein CORC01_12499 [Colletotrichum orchidophilum]OHE92205.1 hypothetical protein CORC01_12499 [Colletotrichum orchidophilum]